MIAERVQPKGVGTVSTPFYLLNGTNSHISSPGVIGKPLLDRWLRKVY
jgi:hypothetical protein